MKWLLGAGLLFAASLMAAPLVVVDDLGRQIRLEAPAQRIVALAPHLTENLFAVGAGAQLVGAVEFSDYPEAAKAVPRVGGYSQINLEALIALQPDLIVAWHSGNNARLKELLKPLGIPVYYSEPRSFELIATTLERLGILSGHAEQGLLAATGFRQRLADLVEVQGARTSVRVFFEIWSDPLMSINREHLISQVIDLCGGENIFAGSPALVPRVGIEGVIAGNPEVILSGDKTSPHGSGQEELRARWARWSSIPAVAKGQVYTIDGELILRHTQRILAGADQLCARLDQARQRFASTSAE